MSAATSDAPGDQAENRDLLKVVAAAIAFLEALRELLEPAPSAAPVHAPRPVSGARLQRIDIDGPE
jgi:hypothetical protein